MANMQKFKMGIRTPKKKPTSEQLSYRSNKRVYLSGLFQKYKPRLSDHYHLL